MAEKCEIYLAAKSLFFNVAFDMGPGHTPTVATNIRQKGVTNSRIGPILDFSYYMTGDQLPDLARGLTKKARTSCVIRRIYVFDHVRFNGSPVDVDASFCMFVKEETDPSKEQYGRLSLHYPFTLRYEPLNIDNRRVFEAIKEKAKGYATKVYSLSLDGDSIDFNSYIIGSKGAPLSLALETSSDNDMWAEIQMPSYLRAYNLEKIGLRESGEGDLDLKAIRSQGIEAFKEAKADALQILSKGARDSEDVSSLNPLCPYDIFCRDSEGKARYYVVKLSFSNQINSILSEEQKLFMLEFQGSSRIIYFKSYKRDKTFQILDIREYMQLSS